MSINQSELWGMDMSLEKLINHNKYCKINTNSTHHFETYGGILIYVTHPNSTEEYSIQLGVDEFGIQYEGDYGCKDSFKIVPINTGLQILEEYRKLIEQRNRLERLLVRNMLDESTVAINIR